MKEMHFVFLVLISILSVNAMAKDDVVNQEVVTRTESETVDTWQVICSFGKNNQKLGCTAVIKITQQIAAKSDKENRRTVL